MAGETTTRVDAFELRKATPDDGEALRRLYEGNPDGGAIQFAPRFKTNPYRGYSELIPKKEFEGYIAETPTGDVAGAGFIAISDARVGGELRPRGYMAGLAVDHEYRGMGLAKRLAGERIRYAEEVAGEDVVISAAIQEGNEASTAVAQSWADGFPYEYVNLPIELLDEHEDSAHEIRSIDEGDLLEFVRGINEFYGDAELFVPYQVDRLAEMLAVSLGGNTIHRCDGVIDNGELVAGAHLVQTHKAMTAVVTDLPAELEEADELPPSIPADRELRPTFVIPWFKPGNEDAGESLIEYERANAGEANRVMIPFDPTGPLEHLDTLRVDDGTLRLSWAIRGLDDPVDSTFVAPVIG